MEGNCKRQREIPSKYKRNIVVAYIAIIAVTSEKSNLLPVKRRLVLAGHEKTLS